MYQLTTRNSCLLAAPSGLPSINAPCRCECLCCRCNTCRVGLCGLHTIHKHVLHAWLTAGTTHLPPSLPPFPQVGTILDTLRGTAHNAFPVIAPSGDGDAHIMGVVLRSHLLVLLRSRRCFQPSSFVSEAASRVAFSYHMAEFASPISEGGPGLEQVVLSNEQLGMFLDLGPYVNPSYYVVQVRAGMGMLVSTCAGGLAAEALLWPIPIHPSCSSVPIVTTRPCGSNLAV